MQHVTYQELIERYGPAMAHGHLMTIERAAKIRNKVVFLDKEIRLARALEALEQKRLMQEVTGKHSYAKEHPQTLEIS